MAYTKIYLYSESDQEALIQAWVDKLDRVDTQNKKTRQHLLFLLKNPKEDPASRLAHFNKYRRELLDSTDAWKDRPGIFKELFHFLTLGAMRKFCSNLKAALTQDIVIKETKPVGQITYEKNLYQISPPPNHSQQSIYRKLLLKGQYEPLLYQFKQFLAQEKYSEEEFSTFLHALHNLKPHLEPELYHQLLQEAFEKNAPQFFAYFFNLRFIPKPQASLYQFNYSESYFLCKYLSTYFTDAGDPYSASRLLVIIAASHRPELAQYLPLAKLLQSNPTPQSLETLYNSFIKSLPLDQLESWKLEEEKNLHPAILLERSLKYNHAITMDPLLKQVTHHLLMPHFLDYLNNPNDRARHIDETYNRIAINILNKPIQSIQPSLNITLDNFKDILAPEDTGLDSGLHPAEVAATELLLRANNPALFIMKLEEICTYIEPRDVAWIRLKVEEAYNDTYKKTFPHLMTIFNIYTKGYASKKAYSQASYSITEHLKLVEYALSNLEGINNLIKSTQKGDTPEFTLAELLSQKQNIIQITDNSLHACLSLITHDDRETFLNLVKKFFEASMPIAAVAVEKKQRSSLRRSESSRKLSGNNIFQQAPNSNPRNIAPGFACL